MPGRQPLRHTEYVYCKVDNMYIVYIHTYSEYSLQQYCAYFYLSVPVDNILIMRIIHREILEPCQFSPIRICAQMCFCMSAIK
jgi:hypothetical protein